MSKINSVKLLKILKDNKDWPIIIEGVSVIDFSNSIVIPANIPSSQLGVIPSENGYKYPSWLMELIINSKKNNNIQICIRGLDEISQDEQQKFYGLIKYKGINGYKFPEGAQIIIPVNNLEKISKRILSLSLVYKMG